ncbi:hypothetical protein [Viridibacillus sp. FSL H8-0110]|uniref:hypothetical protein n=1 Tax=Viridibacillus sp. FSL H8-0110 TaxID=2921376 RepID=UPI0030FAEAFF
MKRLVLLIVAIALLVGVGGFYYANVDKNYFELQKFYDFPVPNSATLESENQNAKNYIWEPSTGTDVPLTYQLMIKKSGWKQVEIDGHSVIYKKGDEFIQLVLAPDYIGILKE